MQMELRQMVGMAAGWVSLSLMFVAQAHAEPRIFNAPPRWVQIDAANVAARDQVVNCGISIEAIRSDSVWGFAHARGLQCLERNTKLRVLGDFSAEVGRGGHQGPHGFPCEGTPGYRTVEQTEAALKDLATRNPSFVRLISIGRTIQGRNIWALHINTNSADLMSGFSNKPAAVYMGNHHAREHLSNEIPLRWAEWLIAHAGERDLRPRIEGRDIWIIPMVNPDGAAFDVSACRVRYWRKNLRDNGNGSVGVDLNRNYGQNFGGEGSSSHPESEIFHGPAPFSEPETQAVREFVMKRPNIRTLLSFHTFSELILYPWGSTHEEITNKDDLVMLQTMARTMAQWNRYTPQQSSELYVASGDTTDWAYEMSAAWPRRILPFTFELSPSSMSQGGFYPDARIIPQVFEANLKPMIYMLDMAGMPTEFGDFRRRR